MFDKIEYKLLISGYMTKNEYKNLINKYMDEFNISYITAKQYLRFNAPSHPSRGDQAVNAHTTRVPAPPIPSGWGGLIYGIR